MTDAIRKPRNDFQRIVQKLAITAQATLYHDIDESMPEYVHGVQTLEHKFSLILRGKVKP